jgi:nucleoside transporter
MAQEQMSWPTPGARNVVPQLCVMMFLQFFVWGSWYVSMTGFMNDQKMGGLIPTAYSVGPIAAIISPFFVGLIADRFFATQRVLAALHLLGGLALIAAPSLASVYIAPTEANSGSGSSWMQPYILLLLLHMLCYMPTLALTTSLSFAHLTNQEKQFPIVRVFGTIGWIVGNIAVSFLPGKDQSSSQFMLAGGAAIALAVFCLTLPHTPPPRRGQRISAGQILGVDALGLLKNPSFAVFILCSFLLCIPLAGYYAFARNFTEAAGAVVNKSATFTMSFGQMSEIFFMLVMPLCFARLGVKWMLAVGMLAWVMRYWFFSHAWDAGGGQHIKWMVLAGIILHGICYDFFFVTGMIYVDKFAPAQIRGQAQGLLVLVTQGLGMFIGAQVFGVLAAKYTSKNAAGQDVMAWDSFWFVPCVAAGAIMLVFIALFRERNAASRDGAAIEGHGA